MRRGLLGPLLVTGLVYAGIQFMENQYWGQMIAEFFRARHSMFTREPLLQTYVALFCENFIIKLFAIFWIFAILLAKRRPLTQSLGLGHFCRDGRRLGPIYINFFICLGIILYLQGLDPHVPDLPTPLFFEDSSAVGNTLAIISIVLVAPLTEEIAFRGYLYPALSEKCGAFFAISITTFLFTLIHYPQMNQEPLWLLPVLLSGYILTLARARSGSVWPSVMLHFFYNAGVLLAGFARCSWILV